MHVIKYSFHLNSTPLMNIINLSLLKGIFPDKLNIGKVIPVYKAEDPCLFVNYRPISLLPNVLQFFEKVMCNRLTEFAVKYELLYSCHFGFRKNHSMSLALIHLMNKISSAIDRREITAGVFLDLSKAFDTLDHEIFFAKLEHYGICDVALRWIKSYFSCRQQFVQFNEACSTKQTIKCGVPQGSILGPLFFILYINDLPDASNLTQPLLFADDTSIFYSHSDPNRLQSILNEELSNFDVWLKCNKLSVDLKRNNYIFFKSRQKERNYHFTIFFGNQPLVQANMT